LCDQREVELFEGHECADQEHKCLSIPAKKRAHNWVLEVEERHANPPGVANGATDDRAALLGARMLRKQGGSGGELDPEVDPGAGQPVRTRR